MIASINNISKGEIVRSIITGRRYAVAHIKSSGWLTIKPLNRSGVEKEVRFETMKSEA